MAGIVPLDLFLSPYQGPGQLPTTGPGWNAIGQLGQTLREQGNYNRQMAQKDEQFAQTHAMQMEEMQGKNKYYADLIDARKEATRDKAKEAKDKRVAFLMDAYRKAKMGTPEREMIRQELTRIGYSVEEGETDLPEPEPATSSIPGEVAPKTAIKGTATPKVNPQFKTALDTFMATQNGPNDDATGLGAPSIQTDGSPMPWEALGLPAAPPPKPRRGGKFTIRDPEGNLAMTYDEPMEQARQKAGIAAVLSPFIGDASNPEEQAAAATASKAAQAAIASGFTQQDAVKLGMDAYHKEMGRFKTERRPSSIVAGAGGTGMSKEERIRRGSLSDDTLQAIKAISQDRALPDARKNLAMIANMDENLASADKEGFAGGAAMSQYIKSVSGAQVSDSERNFIFGGEGKMAALEAQLNQYTNGGKLPGDLVRALKGVAQRARKVFNDRVQEADQAIGGYFDSVPGLSNKEERENQKAAARAYLGIGPVSGGGGGGSMSPEKQRLRDEARKLLQGLP